MLEPNHPRVASSFLADRRPSRLRLSPPKPPLAELLGGKIYMPSTIRLWFVTNIAWQPEDHGRTFATELLVDTEMLVDPDVELAFDIRSGPTAVTANRPRQTLAHQFAVTFYEQGFYRFALAMDGEVVTEAVFAARKRPVPDDISSLT